MPADGLRPNAGKSPFHLRAIEFVALATEYESDDTARTIHRHGTRVRLPDDTDHTGRSDDARQAPMPFPAFDRAQACMHSCLDGTYG